MPTVVFVDAHGVKWRVWSTIPQEGSPLAKYYPGGWLTFDHGGDTLRRLSPAPPAWQDSAPEKLELMCRVAIEVPRHTGERVKMPRPTSGPLAVPREEMADLRPAEEGNATDSAASGIRRELTLDDREHPSSGERP